jgi:hypothetical protein
MYSLALIIFVVSEKKAFEHFPIGTNVNLCITIKAKLYMNVHWRVLYKLSVFVYMSCGGSHLGFPIDIRCKNFVEDLPMTIPFQFGFNCPSDFREEAF